MKTIRVIIADDNSMTRALLRSLLESQEGIEVVGEAGNGRQAVALVRELQPNLVTMDLDMPVMSGLEAIEEIMHHKAVPILVVSTLTNAQLAIEAMERGALEVIGKPNQTDEMAAHFIAKVRMIAGVSVITRIRPGRKTPEVLPNQPASTPITMETLSYPHVFAIASSTGGPQALARILPELRTNFLCPVIIAQHISNGFAHGVVDWLGKLCKLPVRLAAEGDFLQAGIIYISPSEYHCTITPKRRIALIEPEHIDIYHPSCDKLLNSVANIFTHRAVGIILTGMGNDGVLGMTQIRNKGGITLAQNETTSMIYGMNRVAIQAGAVQQILPVDAIAAEMTRLSHTHISQEKP